VSFPTGTYELGPDDGTLSVRTGRKGAAAKAGHDLLIHVTAWRGTLRLADDPADTSVELEADATSLRVREGTGGMQSLGDDDKANIHTTIDDEVLKRQAIAFRSTRVTGAGGRLSVEGELTLAGTTRPLAFDLAVSDDGRLTGTAVVTQSEWGMKPYSALFGALKVADDVRVEIDAALPQSA
jgi:polyisoprenoid-binding protein YceI